MSGRLSPGWDATEAVHCVKRPIAYHLVLPERTHHLPGPGASPYKLSGHLMRTPPGPRTPACPGDQEEGMNCHTVHSALSSPQDSQES